MASIPVDPASLADYRRRVADLYAEVRRAGADEASWDAWTRARGDLFSSHEQSPLDPSRRSRTQPIEYFDYDPTWQVIGTVGPLDTEADYPNLSEEDSVLCPVATVTFERGDATHRLGLYWLDAYGGGLFLPFGDETNGTTTYGGGRYLLDAAKSADLGSRSPDQLVLDFNFAYHPSCAWQPLWPCPLSPPGNRLPIAVEAGERLT